MAVANVESPVVVERVAALEWKLIAHVLGVEARCVLAGQVALEGLNVFARPRRLMMIRNHERGRL